MRLFFTSFFKSYFLKSFVVTVNNLFDSTVGSWMAQEHFLSNGLLDLLRLVFSLFTFPMTLLNISFNGLWIYKNILSLKYKIQHVPIQVQCICILRHEQFVSNKYFAIPPFLLWLVGQFERYGDWSKERVVIESSCNKKPNWGDKRFQIDGYFFNIEWVSN